MAGRGPAPKPDSERVRRNADPAPAVFVEADGVSHGPDLPDEWMIDGEGWPAATRAWWETWRRSPQAGTFTDTDWSFLLDTASLHAQFWTGGPPKLAGEIRLRVAKFGATPEDRLRLRMAVGKPAGNTEPAKLKPAPAEDRDAQILQLVQGVS